MEPFAVYLDLMTGAWAIASTGFLFILGSPLSEDFGQSSARAHSHVLGEHLGEAQNSREVFQSPPSPYVTGDGLSLSSP